MHPAFSVIFFTVTSGAGYGVLVFLGIIGLFIPEVFTEVGAPEIFLIGGAIGLGMVIIGLMSSSLHLANKKNAWRAFFRFRSSWLSREAIFAVVSIPVVLAFFASFYFDMGSTLIQLLAVFVIILSLLTVYSTGMIYGCLKTIRAWNTPLVPFNYVLLGLISGNIILTVYFDYYQMHSPLLESSLIVLLVLGFISKAIYFSYIGQPSPWSVKTATNLPGNTVRLLDTGESSTNNNFLMREFGYVITQDLSTITRVFALVAMFIVPAIMLFIPLDFGLLMAIAFINYAGTLAERWLFFAEAKHVVNLFYGREA